MELAREAALALAEAAFLLWEQVGDCDQRMGDDQQDVARSHGALLSSGKVAELRRNGDRLGGAHPGRKSARSVAYRTLSR